MQPEWTDFVRSCRYCVPVEHGADSRWLIVCQARDARHYSGGRKQRNSWSLAAAEPSRAKEAVQIDDVVWVLVGDDHGINSVSDRGAQKREQAGKCSVTQIDYHPIARVLDKEATAGTVRLRPSAAPAENRQSTDQATSLSVSTGTARAITKSKPRPKRVREVVLMTTISPMATLHFKHREAQESLRGAIDRFVDTAESLTDLDLLAPSRCYGWTVLDVVVHVRTGLLEMLGGFSAGTSKPADQDAASYWRDYAGDEDQVEPILWTRRTSSAYARPAQAVQHLRMTADAVMRSITLLQEGRVSFQNHVLSSGDWMGTWAVEIVVHQLDLCHTLDVAEPTSPSVAMARKTVETLIETDLPAEWSDIRCVLLGAGRLVPNPGEQEHLGSTAGQLPVLG